MQSVIGGVMAISAFGAAYVANLVFPVKPIEEADLLLSQSTIGTVNIFNKEELERDKKTPRQLIEIYLQRKANLEDVIEIITGKSSIQEAYAKLLQMNETPEIKFLIRATERNYNMGDNEKPQPNAGMPLSSSVPSASPIRPSARAAAAAESMVKAVRHPSQTPSVSPVSRPPPSAPPVEPVPRPPYAPSVSLPSRPPPSAPPPSVGIGVPITTLSTPPPPPQPSSSWPPPNYRIPTLEEHLEQRFSN